MKLFLCVFLLIGSPYFLSLCHCDPEQITGIRIGENNEFVVGEEILGEGSFGEVRTGLNTLTGEKVAVKLELNTTASYLPILPTEKISYDIIGPQSGIPKVYYFGQIEDGKYNVLVMEYLSNSLDTLLKNQDNKFSEKTTYMIGIQLMSRIELVHGKGLLHRDINPNHVGISSGELIYLYGFGLAKPYVNAIGHIKEQRATGSAVGTPRYMSAYAHIHREQSRRDDLESIGFMLMSFVKRQLIWDNAWPKFYYQLKRNLNFAQFCYAYPKEILQYFQYVRNLSFEQKPDYEYLRKLFRGALKSIGAEEDYKFDWMA